MTNTNLTINKHIIGTGERVATLRLTLNLTAEDIAYALADHNGDLYWTNEEDFAGPSGLTVDNLREALYSLFRDGLENTHYRAGDNGTDDRVEAYTAAVTERFFGGKQFVD